VAHPATMTHASMDPAARAAAGIGEGMLRLSVGIEDSGDLVADLLQALDQCCVEEESDVALSDVVRSDAPLA